MTETSVEQAAQHAPLEHEATPPRDLRPSDFLNLFSRPRRFFGKGINLGATGMLLVATWIVGMSAQQDRIDTEILMVSMGVERSSWAFLEPVVNGSWLMFWTWIVVAGIVSGGVLYLLGGWWYRMRLRLSGAPKDTDKTAARAVYMYSGIVAALPTVVMGLAYTIFYDNYMAAYNSDELVSSFLPIFLFWSVAVSYVGATERFPVSRWKARIWFLVLPMIFYLVIIAAALGVFAFFSEGI